VKRISAVAQVRRRNNALDRRAGGVLFNLFFAFHVVANRRARATLTLAGFLATERRSKMWWKIPLEILLAIVLLTIGSSFWSILKSRGHLHHLLTNETELKRLLDFWTPSQIIQEGRDIKPVFGSFLQNIHLFEKAHFAALNKTRNLTLIVAVILMAVSYVMGLPYVIASLAAFILRSFAPIADSAKNNKATHVHTVILNVYKWNQTDPEECSRYCEQDPGLKQPYRMVNRLA
jgi:hypothetical protein